MLFEEMLANIEQPERKLLTVVLVGQPELADRLSDPSLHRPALRTVPLTLRESAAVAKRIGMAGGNAQVFTRDAVLAIYEHSGGIPRTIYAICENALVSAYARDESTIPRTNSWPRSPATSTSTRPRSRSSPPPSVADAVRLRRASCPCRRRGSGHPRRRRRSARWSPLRRWEACRPFRGRRRSFWRVLQFWKR